MSDAQSQMSDAQSQMSDAEFSQRLHERMRECGFTAARSRVWQRAADALEQLANDASPLAQQRYFLCGSYAEAWGCHLVRMDGRVDGDSDIDWTAVEAGRRHHFPSTCSCSEQQQMDTRSEAEQGHVVVGVTVGQPAQATAPIGVRPAVDHCEAVDCCSMGSGVQEQLVLQPPQLVHACRPGRPGDMRLSFTPRERQLMRSLTEVQGQLYVLLKFLIKRTLPQQKRVQGLKSYHAKTLVFHAVTQLPASAFEPQELVALVDSSLRLLLEFLGRGNDDDGVCMWSIFQRDAPIYFKSDASPKARIRLAVSELRQELRRHLASCQQLLLPLQHASWFFFHPFAWLPRCQLQPKPAAHSLADAYGFVLHSLQLLTRSATQRELSCLLPQLQAAPTCMATAAACLAAMLQLKLGDSAAAVAALPPPSSSVMRQLQDSPAAPSVMQQLQQGDSAWRFCFSIRHWPDLSFLPSPARDCCFSINTDGLCYINFHALSMCLRLSIMRQQAEAEAEIQHLLQQWLEETADRCDWDVVDFQELHCISAFASHAAQLSFCLQQMQRLQDSSQQAVSSIASVRARLAAADRLRLWHQQLLEAAAAAPQQQQQQEVDLIAFGHSAIARQHVEFAINHLQLPHPSRGLETGLMVHSLLQRLHPSDASKRLYLQLRRCPQPPFHQLFVLGLRAANRCQLQFAFNRMRAVNRFNLEERWMLEMIRWKVNGFWCEDFWAALRLDTRQLVNMFLRLRDDRMSRLTSD